VAQLEDALSMSNPAGSSRRSVARIGRVVVGTLVAVLAGPPLAGAAATAQPGWSSAVSLIRCASVAAPHVVFPAADPFHSSGQGAILWTGDPADCASSGGAGVGLAEFEPDHTLGAPEQLRVGGAPLASLTAVTSTGNGRIVTAGDIDSAGSAAGGLSQGPAGGTFTGADPLGGPSTPIAATSSYRGDVGVASVSAGGKVELRVEQRDAPAISPPVVLTPRGAKVTAIAVNLDFRGDAIVAWAERGSIFVRVRDSTGVLRPTRRVAASPPAPRLGVLISDDDRGILAWEADARPHGSATTTTSAYLDVSQVGVRFGPPHLLERFADPRGLIPPATGLQLVRLAYEGVIVAWTGLAEGHFAIRTAPVSLSSFRPTTTISDPDADAMLSDLATGPADEVIALWTAAPRSGGRPEPDHERLVSARGTSDPSGVTKFDSPQLVDGPGPVTTPRIAIDPVTDVAVAVWLNRSNNPGIDYAVRAPTPSGSALGGRPATKAGRRGGTGAPAVLTVVITLVLAITAFLVGLRRRARSKEDRASSDARPRRTFDVRSLLRRLSRSLNLIRSDS
jgi:hypothetical protein